MNCQPPHYDSNECNRQNGCDPRYQNSGYDQRYQNNGYGPSNGYNNYGGPQGPNYNPWNANEVFASSPVTGKSRGVAALLAILLGSLGIHYFYCGKNGAGITFLLVSLLSCGVLAVVPAIIALISGIKMFCMTNIEFDERYVMTPTSFPI